MKYKKYWDRNGMELKYDFTFNLLKIKKKLLKFYKTLKIFKNS